MNKFVLAGAVLGLASGIAQADAPLNKGDWLVRAGVSIVAPDSDGSDLSDLGGATVRADDATSVTFTGAYMFADNFSVELLASTPFEHDIEVDGSKVGETKQLPPTLSVQWHFPIGDFVPYVGAGVNYTVFFDEDTNSSLPNSTLNLDSSLGLAGQVGVDWFFDNNWLVNLNVRYIDIETHAEINGDVAVSGDVDINPWIYGIHAGYRF